jgi:hypothetical protein
VADALARRGTADVLDALAACAAAESAWTAASGIPLVTDFQRVVAARIPAHVAVVKALGAGGGDSVGVFFDRDALRPGARSTLARAGLDARQVALETDGVRVG